MKKGFLLVSILLVINILHVANANSDNEHSGPAKHQEVSSEAYLHALRSHQTTGKINPAEVIQASLQAQAMLTTRNLSSLNWTSLGPDNYGGKTRGIIYDNKDASNQTILAGAAGGGIWKSTNGGITWNPVGNNNLMVSAMVQNAAGDIYVGTGDGFNAHFFNVLESIGYTSGFIGNGIWKSTDGQSFSQLSATIPQANKNTAAWAYVNEMAINVEGHVFASTNAGLKYSTDGGATWLTAKNTAGEELSMNSSDVQVATDGSLAASVDNKLYISKSGNPEAFQLISTGEGNMLPFENVTRVESAFAPSNPNVMYVSLVTGTGVQLGIYRSVNKGDSWEVILPATASVNVYGGRGNYNNHITVFPDDPDRILVGGVNLWQGKKVVEGGLFAWDLKSISGGAGLLNNYLHFGQHRLVFKPGSSSSFFTATDGGVQEGSTNGDDLVFSLNNRNYITSQFYTVSPTGFENRVIGGAQDQGVIYISSEGNSPRQGETLYAVNSAGGPSVVSTINPDAIVVTTLAGAMQRSEDMAFTFSNQFLATGIINPQAYQTPIALWENYDDYNNGDSVTFKAKKSYQGGDIIKVRSKNFEQPFYYTLPANQNLNAGDTLRVKDIVTSKLFVATANKVWMTKEFLNFAKLPSWFEISNTSVGFSGIPQSIGLSKDGNHVFIGTREGKLFRISNLAIAYNYERADVNSPSCIVATKAMEINLPGTTTPISQAITSVSVDPSNPNKVLITLGNYGNDHYVYTTNNALDANPTFTSRQGNLPKMPVYSSVLEMSNSGLAIIGTEFGIYQSNDAFTASPVWTADQNMANIPVFNLKQQLINKSSDTLQLINVDTLVKTFPGTNNYGIIYAATFGRGLFRCNEYRKPVGIDEPTTAGTFAVQLNLYPNPAKAFTLVDFELKQQSEASLSVFDLQGKMVLQQSLGKMASGKHQHRLDLTAIPSGAYILRLQTNEGAKAVKFLVY